MRALINAVPLYGKGEGARTYVAEFLKALSASDADMEWHTLLRDVDAERLGISTDPRFRRIPFAGLAAPPATPGVRFLWRNTIDQAVIPLASRRVDVTHYLDSYGPIWMPAGSPFVLTVHDLLPITNPEHFSPWVARYLAFLMRAVPRADGLMAGSETTASAITAQFGVPAERIRVIPYGVDGRFHPASASEREAVARRYQVEGPYLIAVGAVERRKNLARVIRAFAHARRAANFPQRLLIVGKPGFGFEEIEAALRTADIGGAARMLGYLPPEDIPPLISGADALIHLSLAEGFGLPVVEGMACGAPVITSSTSSLAEVAGDAGYLVDPADESAISQALIAICAEDALRARLREASLLRARAFSWGYVADAAIAMYRDIVTRRQREGRRPAGVRPSTPH